jgi:hypothetical protein
MNLKESARKVVMYLCRKLSVVYNITWLYLFIVNWPGVLWPVLSDNPVCPENNSFLEIIPPPFGHPPWKRGVE